MELIDYAIEQVIELAKVKQVMGGWEAEALGVIVNRDEREDDCDYDMDEVMIDLLMEYIKDNYSWQKIVIAIQEDYDLDSFNHSWDESYVSVGRNYSWLVVTDYEADQMASDRAREYCYSEIMTQIPIHLHRYFNVNEWIEDHEGDRGEWLSHNNGYEAEFWLGTENVYIYLQ